jgi:hypothetical protein
LEIKHFKIFFGLKSVDDFRAPSLRTKEMKAATELFLGQNVDIRGLSSAVHRIPTYIFSCSGDDGNESYASDIASDGRNMNRPNVNAWGDEKELGKEVREEEKQVESYLSELRAAIHSHERPAFRYWIDVFLTVTTSSRSINTLSSGGVLDRSKFESGARDKVRYAT